MNDFIFEFFQREKVKKASVVQKIIAGVKLSFNYPVTATEIRR